MPDFSTSDGIRLSYEDTGADAGADAGAPLLCLAGLTRSAADFDHFATALNQRRRIIRLDARGRGGSEWDPNPDNYTMAQEAEDALALLDRLGLQGAVAIGSSRGAILAMLIAAKAPGYLSGIVMNDAGPDASVDNLRRLVDQVGGPIPFGTMDAAADGLSQHLARAFPDWGPAEFRAFAERSYVKTPQGLHHNYDPALRDALKAQLTEIEAEGHILWTAFAQLGATPTLVLKAENSPILDEAIIDRMFRVKPDIALRRIPRVGHAPRLDEPAALAAIREFLDKVDHDRSDRHLSHPCGGGPARRQRPAHPAFGGGDPEPSRRTANLGEGGMPAAHRQL